MTTTIPLPWDTGIKWRVEEASRDDTFLALTVDFCEQYVLRVADGSAESTLVEHYIKSAMELGEKISGQHIIPKTLTMTLDAFPAGAIEFSDGPVREVTSIAYLDTAGDSQIYDNVSPHTWTFLAGGFSRRALVQPAYGESWPAAIEQPNAVTVTFEVGYALAADVPHRIKQAIAVTVGEFYKSPDLSNADRMEANVLTLAHFWPRNWSNAL